MVVKKIIIISILLLSFGTISYADDKDTSPWDGTNVAFGGVSNSGNSDTASYTGSTEVIYTKPWWNNNFNLSGLFSESDGSRNAQSFTIADTIRLSCCPPSSNKTSYILAESTNTVDAFSAYKYTANLSIGYGNDWIKTDSFTFSTSIAPGYSQSAVQGTNEIQDSWIMNSTITSAWNFSKKSSLQEVLTHTLYETYWKNSSTTSLNSSITGSLSVKLSYILSYISKIPEGSDYTYKTNKTTTINLVYNF